jgi:ATP-dependent DNA helicase RecQ
VAPLRRLTLLVAEGPRPLIAFARSRRGTELAAQHLRRALPAVATRFYHAGLGAAERALIERWFLHAHDAVLVATSAYGMGVDKGDIRAVVHIGPSASIEAYLQETGRAGRDGAAAVAVLLHHPALARSRRQHPLEVGERAGMLSAYAYESRVCRRAQLLRHFRQERVECAGCDVCDAAAVAALPAEQEVFRALRRGSRRFTPRQWQLLLQGRARGAYRRAPGFGLLRGWDDDEVGELLDTLLALDMTQVPRRGLWRGRLRLRRGNSSAALLQPGS